MNYADKITPDEAMAFLEDFAAVCIKHGLGLGSYDEMSLGRLTPAENRVFIDKDGDLFFCHTEKPYGRSKNQDNLASVELTKSAHGRLAAASRVQSLCREGGE